MVKLIEILTEWVAKSIPSLECMGEKIIGPCDCGSKARMGLIFDDYVMLSSTNCKCTDCRTTQIVAGDPDFFAILEASLRARIEHGSVMVDTTVMPGDDIQHVVDHYSGTEVSIILSAGTYSDVYLNLKDAKISLSGAASFNNCTFNDITKPVSSDFSTSFVNCNFWASKDQPPKFALDLSNDCTIIGNTFDGAGIQLRSVDP